ncbi:phospholipase D family protein [Yersinia alsatica]|uniref:phospholipase D family nuclease n=1 Tax=Yersinia alsatica TaxID=2890317 RepID=UPI0032EEA4E9
MKRLLLSALLVPILSIVAIADIDTNEPDCPVSHEVGFSPNRGSLALILKEIDAAESEILVAAYSFTSQPIVDALVDAHLRGVAVSIVVNKGSINGNGAKARDIEEKGVSIRANTKYAIMHNKFMVIDGHTVETGSFNYSAAAVNRNAENVLILKCVSSVTDSYKEEFQRLWEESIALPARVS